MQNKYVEPLTRNYFLKNKILEVDIFQNFLFLFLVTYSKSIQHETNSIQNRVHLAVCVTL